MITSDCPCGSNQKYSQCCGPFIEKSIPAPSPEALMRSRYSAYTRANTAYLGMTMQGRAAEGFDPATTGQWAKNVEWLGLTIINAPAVSENASVGEVEFIARFRENGKVALLQEISEFKKIGDRWLYVSGRPGHKLGRNDPCPCGSQKKYKKCCGNQV